MTQLLRFSFLFIFVLITNSIFGQHDTLEGKSYDELRDLLNSNYGKDDSLALASSKMFTKKALGDGDIEKQWLGYEAEGSAYKYLGDEKGFTEAYENAVRIVNQNNLDQEKKRLYGQMALGYYFFGNWGKSLENYDKLKKIAIKDEDVFSESIILSQIAAIKTFAGDKNEALKTNKLALYKAEKIPVKTDSLRKQRARVLISTHFSIGRTFIEVQQPDSTLFHVEKALKLSTIADSCSIKYLYFLQADGYINNNDYEKATSSLAKADEFCNINLRQVALFANGYRGEIALNQKQYRASVDYFLKAFREYNVPENEEGFMDDLYKLTAKAYKGLGKLDSANFYLEKYINTSNELNRIKKDVYTTSKLQEVASFQKELNKLAEQKSQNESLLLYGSITGGVIIILLVLFLLRSNKQRKENEHKFEALLAKVATAKAPEHIIDTKDEILDEQTTSDVNPEITQQILDGLKKLEEQNYFLHPACSAHNVAKRIKTNTTYLSKVINAEFGKNFSTYVNDLRINYAIVKLKQDSKFRSYTISSIATELGYKSADSFTKYFKKDTGLLPSFYIKKLNEAA